MDVVTVTCQRDIDQMLLQAESLNKFLSISCNHWVFINDYNANIKKWKKILSPFYTKNKLILIDNSIFEKIPKISCGWCRQQIYKILIYTKIKKDYIILDTKNFFVRLTDLSEYKNINGSGRLNSLYNDTMNDFRKNIIDYSKKLKIAIDYTQLAPETPFVIRSAVMEKLNIDDVIKHITKNRPSEFLFYSIAAKKNNLLFDDQLFSGLSKDKVSHIFWESCPLGSFDSKNFFINSSNIKILAFHFRYLEQLDNKGIHDLNEYLKSLGLLSELNNQKRIHE